MPEHESRWNARVVHPQLQKYRGRLVSIRVPGLRGKRTGWVIDADDEEWNWRDDLGDALALEGIRKHSARVKCALLAWDCIDRALGDLQPSGSMRDEIK